MPEGWTVMDVVAWVAVWTVVSVTLAFASAAVFGWLNGRRR